jgi:hypothetical protein
MIDVVSVILLWCCFSFDAQFSQALVATVYIVTKQSNNESTVFWNRVVVLAKANISMWGHAKNKARPLVAHEWQAQIPLVKIAGGLEIVTRIKGNESVKVHVL